MDWWSEARFGMFVHWGIYSGLAGNWNGKAADEPEGIFVPLKIKADTGSYAIHFSLNTRTGPSRPLEAGGVSGLKR